MGWLRGYQGVVFVEPPARSSCVFVDKVINFAISVAVVDSNHGLAIEILGYECHHPLLWKRAGGQAAALSARARLLTISSQYLYVGLQLC